MPTYPNPTITHNAERLLTALQNNRVFIKNQQNVIEQLEVDENTFIWFQQLLSHSQPKDKPKERTFVSLADGFRNLKNADKMDFDIDFDDDCYHQVQDFSDLETVFDD